NSRQALRRSKREREFFRNLLSPDATKNSCTRDIFSLLVPHYGVQNVEGSLLQLAGSAPIFSRRSAKLFMVSFIDPWGTGGTQSPGIETTRTSTSALRLSREISAIVKRCLTAVAVA